MAPRKTSPKKTESLDADVNSPLTVNSVPKAFRVLTAFNRNEPRLTLKQIGEKLEIDKSTAQRFTHTLLVMGYLNKDPATKTLGVTVKLLDLAHIYLSSNPLIAAAMPYMIHLSRESGETANLTVLDGADVVFVSRIVGNHLLSTGVGIGTRLPAYAAATGLAMMSALSDAEVQEVLEKSDLKPLAPNTVYEPRKILERIKIARSKGYVLSVADYFPNDISLGAPIVSGNGAVVGALSLSMSNDRFTVEEAEAKFAKLLSSAAKSIVV